MGNPSLRWASIPDIVKQNTESKDLTDQWFQYPSREYPNFHFIPFGQNIENRMDSNTINTILTKLRQLFRHKSNGAQIIKNYRKKGWMIPSDVIASIEYYDE